MTSVRTALSAVAIALSVTVAAQAGDAAESYATLKSLDGIWEGPVTTDPPSPFHGKTIRVKMHVTASGHAIIHEMREGGVPETAAYMGDPTVLYLEDGRVKATHYCDADNRTRMEARPSPDPKRVAFDFVDVSGPAQEGYVQDLAFESLAPDHHVEQLTFIVPGRAAGGGGQGAPEKTALHARFDLRRTNP